MDESTTTNEPTDTGVDSTQPADVDTQAAENQPAEPTTPTDSQDEADNQATDPNLEWLQNKGIDPTSPEALAKVAEMYRNAEKQMHQASSEKAQLQSALTEPAQSDVADTYNDDPQTSQLAKEVQAMKMERNVEKFWNNNPDAKQYEDKMTDMVTQDPNLKLLVNNGYFSVEQLYYMAKGADPSRESTLKTEGGREALQKVADKQQAKAVTGNASSSAMATGGPTRETRDAWYAGLTPEQRASPQTQSTLASLL